MRAIVIKQFGDPEMLSVEERPEPKPQANDVLIEVKAFGINRAELPMREGKWPEATEISAIECVGIFKADPTRQFEPGPKVVVFMRGMGRSINGCYAELTSVPASNVVAANTSLSWKAPDCNLGILRHRLGRLAWGHESAACTSVFREFHVRLPGVPGLRDADADESRTR